MIKDRTPASKRRAQQQQQQALSRTIVSGASAAGHTADPARVVVKSEMPACGSGVRIKLEPSTTLDPLQLPPPPLTPSSNSPCSSSIDGVAKNSLLESSSSSGFIGGVPVGHVKRERVDSAVATATTCLDSNAFNNNNNNNNNNNGAHSIASEFMLSDSAPLTSAGHGSGGVSCASVTQAQAAAAAAACNQPAALSSSGAAAAVINKQPMTADAQYMQQQSHIFVFSTQLANRAFEAVVRCQFPTIIAFHCAQPGTRKYLDRHPLKLSQFSRGGGGGGWESANGRRASNSATATVALSTAPVSSRPQSVGLVGSPAAVCGTVCTTSGQPHDAAAATAGGGSVRPHSASAALPAMQPIRTSTAPALPAHSAASPSVANGGAAQFAAMTACSPAPAVNTTCGDDAVSRPLTSVQRLSDEDLTPEQRHHRASQLAALRRLGEMLLPDQHHQQAQQQQQQQPPGAINGAAVPNGVAAAPAVSPMVAADGTVLDPRMPVSPAVPPGAGAPMMDARFMGPGAPVDPRFMAPGGAMMEHRMMAPAGAGGGPMMVPVGPMMEHRMMTPAGGGPMMEHRMMGPAGMAGGGMPVRMMAGGGGGGACMMVPNGAVTSMAAQMEWHRLQSEFYDERRKKTGAVGGGAMMMAAGTVVPAGMRMMMPARMQGPPPPYPQTQVRTSVAAAAGVPVGSMVVPSPGGGGGGGGGSSPTTSLSGVASPRLNSPSVYPRLPTPGPSPGNPVPSPSPRHFNSNPGTPASVGAPAGVTASAVPSPAAGAAVRVAAPEFTPPHSQPSIAAGVPTGSVSPANSLQCSAGGDMFARTAVNSVCAGGGGGANLMPVPSPQQIQYINNFEGQELTIHKQPNTGIRDDTQSVLSPSVSSCSVSAIGSPLLESGVPAGGVRVGVASPRLCHQQQQQHHQHHHHQMSPRFPAPALVDCMPPAGAGRFASPCSMPSAVNKGMVYMERFPMAGCGGMVTRMPRAAAPGAFVDARMSCPEMDMSLAHVPLNPQHPAVMCGGGGAGMPAGGGGGGGGPERVFDPISSMVQMSQQLTGGSPSSSSTGGGGGGGGGFMSGGVMDAGVASPASSTCSGMTGAAAAAAALSPRLMSPSCHAQQQQQAQPPQSLAASPKPGSLTPQHHQQQFMNVSVAGGVGGVMPVRMMARPVTPCGGGGGGGVPTSVQVKPGAPNTIQYLPSRAQCMAGPGGGAGVRGAPPNQFQFHPHHPHLHHQQPQQVMMSMAGGGGGMCPVDPQQHQPQPHMQHMMSARGMMPCAPSNMMMGPAPGGGAMMMAGGPAGGAAAVPSMHHMTTSGPRAGPMMMRQTSVGPMTMMPMSGGGGGDCSAAQSCQPMMAAVGPSSAPSAMFGPAGVQSGKPHMMRPDAAQPLPPSMAQPGAAIKQAQFAAAQPPSAGWFN